MYVIPAIRREEARGIARRGLYGRTRESPGEHGVNKVRLIRRSHPSRVNRGFSRGRARQISRGRFSAEFSSLLCVPLSNFSWIIWLFDIRHKKLNKRNRRGCIRFLRRESRTSDTVLLCRECCLTHTGSGGCVSWEWREESSSPWKTI